VLNISSCVSVDCIIMGQPGLGLRIPSTEFVHADAYDTDRSGLDTHDVEHDETDRHDMRGEISMML